MKIFKITFLLFLYFELNTGLRCWVCENARNNDDCIRRGKMQECASNQKACQNEIRRGSYGMSLTKRCKQALACQNNYIQNLSPAWFPTQCNSRAPSSVCRCCCGTDLCNKNALGCEPFNTTTTTTTSTPSISTSTNSPSSPPLTCLPPIAPTNGNVSCNKSETSSSIEYVIGATCVYSCDKGFTISGPSLTNCTTMKGSIRPTFRPSPPKCQPTTSCRLPEVHENIDIICHEDPLPNGEYAFGSSCDFTCGNETTTTMLCQLQWKHCGEEIFIDFFPLPKIICNPSNDQNTCDKLENIANGKTSCSYSNHVGSTCTFNCEEGYQLHPSSSFSTRCRADQTWDNSMPCCLRSCPPNALMDLVIALDSSTSISEKNWKLMLNFTSNLVNEFNVEDAGTRVGLFRYNRNVDEETQILLKVQQTKDQLLEKIAELSPSSETGTQTGKALRYARNVMFSSANGDRNNVSNVMVVITDGKSQGQRLIRREAKFLKRADITTFAVGVVFDSSGVNAKELLSISGNNNRVIYLQNRSENIYKILSQSIGNFVCKNRTC